MIPTLHDQTTAAIIESREAYVQCDIDITDLHTARNKLGEALAQKAIRNNVVLSDKVVSAIASLDLVLRQTTCQKDIHRSDIDRLNHTMNTLQVA